MNVREASLDDIQILEIHHRKCLKKSGNKKALELKPSEPNNLNLHILMKYLLCTQGF